MNQKAILLILLVISLIVVLLNDILLNDIPEIFSYGDEVGQVLSNLSLAYISSYIFYIVVVVIKEKKDKENIYSTVYGLTGQLVGRAYSVYHDIIIASGTDHTLYDKKTITKDVFIELCKKANPKDIPQNRFLGPLPNAQPANYGQFIYNNSVSNVQHLADRIFNYIVFLDTEHIRLINKLLNSTFFLVAPNLTWPTKNTDFSVYAESMFEYLLYLRELDRYNENVNKKYLGKL